MELTSKVYGTSVQGGGSRRDSQSVDRLYSPSERFFEDNTALRRVLLEAPYLARCSDDKTATRVRPREYALRYPYMQINRPGMVSWLIFDLDHTNSLVWQDEDLPAPNLVVRNRANGHSHLYYAIPSVCTTENARAKPIQYMKAIYAAFAARLNADKEYNSGPVAKTPGHPWWSTTELHNHVYELGELADYVELAVSPWGKGPQIDELGHSRHCILFEQLRFFAYSIVNRERERGTFSAFTRSLEAFAHNHNNFHKHGFSENLPFSSLKATVKSVARWTWDRYSGDSRCHRGAMQLDKKLPLIERQSLAAKRTHEIRHKGTESKIRAACRQLKARGEKLRQAAIAVIAGVSRQTVATYAHVLKEALRPVSVAVLEVARTADHVSPTLMPVLAPEETDGVAKNVNYGVHQVPAAPLVFLEDESFSSCRGVDGDESCSVEPALPD